MLGRVRRPRLPYSASRSLQPAFEQLQLPWLCPALCDRPSARSARRSTATVTERKAAGRRISPAPNRHKFITTPRRAQDRSFAYAAGNDNNYINDEHIPFESLGFPSGEPGSSYPTWAQSRNITELRSFDPEAPLVVQDSLRPAPRRFRESQIGDGGTVSEMLQTLYACLQVGRLERAAITLRRLAAIYKLDAPELINAQNDYLASLIERVVRTKDQGLLKQIQRWFEVDIRGSGIVPNATTYGLMLRASFQESNQLKIDRTIRRYIALAEQANLRDQALATALSTLNSQQIGRVTRVCPTTFYPADDLAVDDKFVTEPAQTIIAPPMDLVDHYIRPQQQKGLGLIALRKSLSGFSQIKDQLPPNEAHKMDEEHPQASSYSRQEILEHNTWESALDRWKEEHLESMKRRRLNSRLQARSIGAIMWTWHEALVPLIREEIRIANQSDLANNKTLLDRTRAMSGPFLQFISPEKISAVTILHCLNRMATGSMDVGTKMIRLVTNLGQAIQDESIAEMIKNRSDGQITKIGGPSLNADDRHKILLRLIRRRRVHGSTALVSPNPGDGLSEIVLPAASLDQDWHPAIKAQLGAALISLLIKVATVESTHTDPKSGKSSKEVQLAFSTSHHYDKGKKYGVLRMSPVLSKKLMLEPVGGALSKHLPMLVEPVPWTQYKKGGFITPGVPVVRSGSQHAQLREYIKAAADSGDMQQVFAALDILGKTPWRINRDVFVVMLEVWNSGRPLANIPPADPQFTYPPEPDSPTDIKQRRVYAYKVREIENARDGMHSARCYHNFQLEVARAYLNETFYFPHNVDFRGRAYPVPPYLNHMAADNCRGLLLFGQGKELGASGLTWLKVHLANVYGYDKASLTERRDFATDHLKEIYDSATNPMKGSRWWLEAEDPWQCLATCIELKNALDSPDPTKFISHLPVHQDGTCNGLQHYAALGGDTIGAKQVNLEPGDRPSDIYTAVADLVRIEVEKEAAEGHQYALLLQDKINRKVVKPTVMTNVYGVTYMGAKRQVATQLKELYPHSFGSDVRLLLFASAYITKKIFTALAVMFNGAHDIQYWLGECASRICEALTAEQIQWIVINAKGGAQESVYRASSVNDKKNKDEYTRFRSSVIWTTPLKMPVVQPYRKSRARSIRTNLQSITLNEASSSDPVSKRKQRQAFPPNFIHSLDATHMLLSALKCNEEGLSFAAVHDSFWTHAADLDTMNGVLRDTFITMHSEDIIGRLAAEFSARYKDCMYLAHVKANSPLGVKIAALRRNVRTVRASADQKRIDELVLEKRRLDLLASENAEERAEGEAMVTPGKLFSTLADQKDLVAFEDLEGSDEAFDMTANPENRDAEAISSSADDDNDDTFESVFGSEEAFVKEAANAEESKLSATLDPDQTRRAKINKAARVAKKTWLWLPLTFPPVPARGSFDVSRLKDSKYFFS